MHKQFILVTTALAGTLVALPQATYAQDAAAPAARAGLEDIVVTARKVEENIQTTPVAVTARGAEAIDSNQIINIADADRERLVVGKRVSVMEELGGRRITKKK